MTTAGQADRKRRRHYLWVAASLALSAALLGWIVAKMDVATFEATMRRVDWWWVAAAYCAVLLYHVFRAHRTSIMLTPRVATGVLFPTICLQAAIRNVAPTWFGDVSLVYLLRRFHSVALTQGSAMIVLLRVLDMFAMLAAACLALVLPGINLDPRVRATVSVALAVVVLIGAALFLVRQYSPRANSVYVRRLEGSFLANAIDRAKHTALNIAWHLHEMSRLHLLPKLLVDTTLMWTAMYVAFVCYLHALNAGLGLSQVLWLFILLLPVDLVPTPTPGNLGAFEAAWFVVLLVLGVSADQATVLAVSSHVLILLSAPLLLAFWLGGRLLAGRGEASLSSSAG